MLHVQEGRETTRTVHVTVHPSAFIGCITFCTGYNPESHWDSRPLNAGSTKDKLKVALRESIRREGFRNPVIAYSCDRGLLIHYGGTRLRAALDLGVEIPVIVYDSAGLYPDEPEVTEANHMEFFTDEPYFYIDHNRNIPLDAHYGIRARDIVRHKPGATAWLGEDDTGVINDELLKVAVERRGGSWEGCE